MIVPARVKDSEWSFGFIVMANAIETATNWNDEITLDEAEAGLLELNHRRDLEA
jgi:hypothetical protein